MWEAAVPRFCNDRSPISQAVVQCIERTRSCAGAIALSWVSKSAHRSWVLLRGTARWRCVPLGNLSVNIRAFYVKPNPDHTSIVSYVRYPTCLSVANESIHTFMAEEIKFSFPKIISVSVTCVNYSIVRTEQCFRLYEKMYIHVHGENVRRRVYVITRFPFYPKSKRLYGHET